MPAAKPESWMFVSISPSARATLLSMYQRVLSGDVQYNPLEFYPAADLVELEEAGLLSTEVSRTETTTRINWFVTGMGEDLAEILLTEETPGDKAIGQGNPAHN